MLSTWCGVATTPLDAVPDEIERIAFLDAIYACDPALKHAEKLNRWLQSPRQHCLAVLPYDDALALLDGEPFVSATGGTWYRSHLMPTNLAATIPFVRAAVGDLAEMRGLDGRVMFLLNRTHADGPRLVPGVSGGRSRSKRMECDERSTVTIWWGAYGGRKTSARRRRSLSSRAASQGRLAVRLHCPG